MVPVFKINCYSLVFLRTNSPTLYGKLLEGNQTYQFDILQVLDAGRLKEFNAPYTLLKNPKTLFAQLVFQTGPTESKRLFEIARQSYYAKKTIPETEEIDATDKPYEESVDSFQSPSDVAIIVPNGTGGQHQSSLQFESTV